MVDNFWTIFLNSDSSEQLALTAALIYCAVLRIPQFCGANVTHLLETCNVPLDGALYIFNEFMPTAI